MPFSAGMKKQLYHRNHLLSYPKGWLESKLHLDRCGAGHRAGAGSISAVGMDLRDAGERDLVS